MPIGSHEKKVLHARARELGLDRDAYEAVLLGAAGVDSSVHLDEDGYRAVMERMDELHEELGIPRKARRRRHDDLAGRPGMASPGQLRLIELLWSRLWEHKRYLKQTSEAREKGLQTWLTRMYRVSHVRFVDRRDAWRAIEALKQWMIREGLDPDAEIGRDR